MIKANELRKNNFVLRDGKIVPVGWNVLGFDTVPDDPVPLTPEILEMCGFVFNNEDSSYWAKKDFGVRFIDGCLFIIGYNRKHNIIKYLHQLQNLYYALTGEELEINELQHA